MQLHKGKLTAKKIRERIKGITNPTRFIIVEEPWATPRFTNDDYSGMTRKQYDEYEKLARDKQRDYGMSISNNEYRNILTLLNDIDIDRALIWEQLHTLHTRHPSKFTILYDAVKQHKDIDDDFIEDIEFTRINAKEWNPRKKRSN